MADATTPSAKTPTEFYLALFPMVMGGIMVILGAIKGNADMINTGLVTMGVTSGGYSVGRGIAKVTTTAADGRTALPPPANATDAASAVAKLL